MHIGEYVFSQLMSFVSTYKFNQCVTRYNGELRVKQLTCREQFLAIMFGQLAFRESLRDIVVCLTAHREKLYHLGFRSLMTLSTLARANERRDWRIYRDYALLLIEEARALYIDDRDAISELDGAIYAIDSTTIELCMSLFPWAKFSDARACVKLHIGIRLSGNIPAFFHISKGTMHDVNFLDMVLFEVDAFYVMDRGYIDFKRFYRIQLAGAFFVTRAKVNLSRTRMYSNPVNKELGVICDQIIRLDGYRASKDYPEKLRRIKYRDTTTGNVYVFITNNFTVDALTIANLYKSRWQIELFFKWVKQHLSVKTFWGRSMNAVKTQICIALCAFLVVAIMKKRLGIERDSYEILQILSVSLFDKIPLVELISKHPLQKSDDAIQNGAQLRCF
ncbi:MAG: IS4 family transposase [Candidatus Shapirobacteria bacterium]|jgi:hypothetical protein